MSHTSRIGYRSCRLKNEKYTSQVGYEYQVQQEKFYLQKLNDRQVTNQTIDQGMGHLETANSHLIGKEEYTRLLNEMTA